MPEIPLHSYPELLSGLNDESPESKKHLLRTLARTDLYFLLRYLLGRTDVEHPWIFERIREVQRAPDGYLDLWARGHYKSTVITYAKTLQDILASHGEEPLPEWGGHEPTFVIFSHTRPAAKAFMRQVKRELEQNLLLRELFPDVIYGDPRAQATMWSEDAGIVVRRASNPKEATLEAWGLVDGQPIGKHWDVLIWDDVVVRESVTTPEMIRKTTEMWELSLNLVSRVPRKRYIGTRYHFNDTYREIMKRGAAIPRQHPATDDGTFEGKPMYLTPEQFEQRSREMGPVTASAQLLLNPIADSAVAFQRDWFQYYRNVDNWRNMNRALLVDPASEKKKTSDFTAMVVVGKGPDANLYVLDMLRDRLNLQERAQAVMRMHRRWKPQRVGYEKYGMQSDLDYLREIMDRENYRFAVDEVAGTMAKADRINRLIPLAAERRIYLPDHLHYSDYQGRSQELVNVLLEEEFLCWPVPVHDDLMDAMARIFDVDLAWPRAAEEGERDRYAARAKQRTGTWMSI